MYSKKDFETDLLYGLKFHQEEGVSSHVLKLQGHAFALALAGRVRKLINEKLPNWNEIIIRIEEDYDSPGYSGRVIVASPVQKNKVMVIIKLLDGKTWCIKFHVSKNYGGTEKIHNTIYDATCRYVTTIDKIADRIVFFLSPVSKLYKRKQSLCRYWKQQMHESLIPILNLYKQLLIELTRRRRQPSSKRGRSWGRHK